jgi:outer membrane immunogenic protein
MRRFVFAAALFFVATCSPLLAADIYQPQPPTVYTPPPPAPPYNWGGFYVGANGGYGFANVNATATLTGNPSVFATATGSENINGFVGGGQIGANLQWNALVLGVEADFQGTGQSQTGNLGCGFGCVLSEEVKIPWFATFRARAGVAWDRILFYGTGGVASLDYSDTLTATAGGINATLLDLSNTQLGWTVGAGVEVAIAENWTARLEYLFMDVSSTLTETAPAFIGGGTVTENVTIKDSIVRAGINFKFYAF